MRGYDGERINAIFEQVPPLIHLEQVFPKLSAAGYEKTSEQTGTPLDPGAYNCIAWAAEDVHHGYWWPTPNGTWPLWVKRETTVPCFVKAFRCLGYVRAKHSRREFGYHKVALFAIHTSRGPTPLPNTDRDFRDWEPTHMARQLPDETWTSKCGGNEDIRHFTIDALESYGKRLDAYGCAILYMKRLMLLSLIVHLVQWLHWQGELVWRRIRTTLSVSTLGCFLHNP
jgi:hypothetical protein